MQNAEKLKGEILKEGLSNMRKELVHNIPEEMVYDIIKEIDQFLIRKSDNKYIEVYYAKGIFPMQGIYRYDEMLYGFLLMNFYINLYYRCMEALRKLRNEKYISVILNELNQIGKIIRQQVLDENLKSRNYVGAKSCYNEYKELLFVATKVLGHKYDKKGKLTIGFIPEEAKELERIRFIYENISFKNRDIIFYDCILDKKDHLSVYDPIELMYSIMNILAQVYAESMLWIKNKVPNEKWNSTTPWQVIEYYKKLIKKNFI